MALTPSPFAASTLPVAAGLARGEYLEERLAS